MVHSHGEAAAYFERAVALSSRVGEENVPSWEAVLDLARAATAAPLEDPELAYSFASAAELRRSWARVGVHGSQLP